MPNVLDLRRRIRSVKSTRQITKAMKMIAAAKLRRAQERRHAPTLQYPSELELATQEFPKPGLGPQKLRNLPLGCELIQ